MKKVSFKGKNCPTLFPLSGIFIIAIFALVLIGCGGGGSNGGLTGQSSEGSGVFLDAAVNGLEFVSDDLSGITGSDGAFSYRSGEAVEFYVGDIFIGAGIGAEIMTPISLSASAEDETDPTVTNICRFLQTIDDDGNPSNGIQITQAVRDSAIGASIDFNQSVSAFESDGGIQSTVNILTSSTSSGERSLVSAFEARNHMRNTLFGLYAGDYSGTFTGGDSGTWNVNVDSSGNITGSLYSNEDTENYWISGSVISSGNTNLIAGDVYTGATFTGTINYVTGHISGTWENTYWSISGTFSGEKT